MHCVALRCELALQRDCRSWFVYYVVCGVFVDVLASLTRPRQCWGERAARPPLPSLGRGDAPAQAGSFFFFVIYSPAKTILDAYFLSSAHVYCNYFQPAAFRCSCVTQTLFYTIKVGRAVALKLAMDGFDVVCCTSSDVRFASLQRELVALLRDDGVSSASCGDGNEAWLDMGEGGGIVPRNGDAENAGPGFAIDQGGTSRGGRLLRAKRVHEGVHHRLWVVGKYDVSVRWGNP